MTEKGKSYNYLCTGTRNFFLFIRNLQLTYLFMVWSFRMETNESGRRVEEKFDSEGLTH